MAQSDGSPAPEGGQTTPKRITALDIQQKEFRVSFRGYNEREVDEFLDVVTEELARLHSENKRFQEQTEYRHTLPLGGEAEDVLRRAKEEAERIVAEARSRAASLSGAAPSPAPVAASAFDATDAVNRFLTRERDFLQVLASKIHQHIEAVKEDARDVRAAASTAGAAPAPSPHRGASDSPGAAAVEGRGGEASGGGGPEDTALYRAVPPPGTDRGPEASGGVGGSSSVGIETGPPTITGRASRPLGGVDVDVDEREVINLEEPTPLAAPAKGDPATNGRVGTSKPESSPTDPSDDDRSLRELFWGED